MDAVVFETPRNVFSYAFIHGVSPQYEALHTLYMATHVTFMYDSWPISILERTEI